MAYHRGKAEGGKAGDRVLLVTSDGWLIALAPDTGKLHGGFGKEGRVDLTQGLRRRIDRRASTWNYAPAVCGDVVVIGNQTIDNSHQRPNWRANVPLGDVRGFDVNTGKQMWVFQTVPQAGEFGNDTWGEESWRWMGNTNVWSMMSCDAALGHVYLPVTAPTSHFYGGLRPGDNLFGTSVVALNAATGKRVWHFQTVHHDIWDYDLPAAPVVVDLVQNGKQVRAVVQVSKVGFLYVFDRVTGTPLWPIEERPVPKSDLEGEQASPTQPFPTWPPPFELQGVRENDLIDFTPKLRERALKRLADVRIGPLFLPPSEQGSLVVPGWGGGANWGGAAFDPEARRLYLASRRMPLLLTARRINLKRPRLSLRGEPWRSSIGRAAHRQAAMVQHHRLPLGQRKHRLAGGQRRRAPPPPGGCAGSICRTWGNRTSRRGYWRPATSSFLATARAASRRARCGRWTRPPANSSGSTRCRVPTTWRRPWATWPAASRLS